VFGKKENSEDIGALAGPAPLPPLLNPKPEEEEEEKAANKNGGLFIVPLLSPFKYSHTNIIAKSKLLPFKLLLLLKALH